MLYKTMYDSPIGRLTLISDGKNLLALLFQKERYGEAMADEAVVEDSLVVFAETKRWLDRYFDGKKPGNHELPLAPVGSPFRQMVWEILREIPYGEVTTYGEIAREIAARTGKEKMSAQAVGGAVGHNPISIIVPCHRVIGSDGNLTGFGGGINVKVKLLEHERVDMSGMYIPAKGTAL